MIDIVQIYDAEQKARKILARIKKGEERVFSDKAIEGIVRAANFDALEDLARGVPAFTPLMLEYIARNDGPEMVGRIFRDYRTARDSKTEAISLLQRARRAISAEKYPVVLTDMSSNSPDVMVA